MEHEEGFPPKDLDSEHPKRRNLSTFTVMSAPSPFLIVLAPFLLAAQGSSSGPPGLLPVHGGRTRVGSTVAEVEALIRAKPELSLAVAGEAPQFTMEVEDFLLMPTEVTNEQYL